MSIPAEQTDCADLSGKIELRERSATTWLPFDSWLSYSKNDLQEFIFIFDSFPSHLSSKVFLAVGGADITWD